MRALARADDGDDRPEAGRGEPVAHDEGEVGALLGRGEQGLPHGVGAHERETAEDQRRGDGPRDAAAVGEHRREHPAGEVGQHRRQALHVRQPGLLVREPLVPADADDDQRERNERLQGAPGSEAQRDPADGGKHEVEGDLDRQGPHRRVELHHRRAREVLGEDGEERQALERREPDAGRVAQAPEQRDGADQRRVVRGKDPGAAAQEVRAEVRPRAIRECGADPGLEEQIAREHEEEDEPQPQLVQGEIGQLIAVIRPRIGQRVEPRMEHQDRDRGEPAQPVEGS